MSRSKKERCERKKELLTTLKYIGEKLNEANITWAVGASVMLSHYGLINNPRDIDIFVSLEDVYKAHEILSSLGEKHPQKNSEIYATEHFHQYTIKDTGIDLMAGFKINHICGIYEYKFNRNSITSTMNIDGVTIPLTSLEDWYVIYQLIPKREEKSKLIEDYLLANGTTKTEILASSLQCDLPDEVRVRVQNMFKRG